ncbi:Integrase OS=Sphingobium scionense OX=1404341 GN=GGQ90_005827 PE=4 SV=1 [Sphingobium scionense]
MSTASQIAASPASPGAYQWNRPMLTINGSSRGECPAFVTGPSGSTGRSRCLMVAASATSDGIACSALPSNSSGRCTPIRRLAEKAVALHTLTVYANYLRVIVLWMATNRFESWAQLDRPAIKDLLRALQGNAASPIALRATTTGSSKPSTSSAASLPEAPPEPPPMLTRLGNWRDGERKPHTPDVIAVPLIAAALHLIGHPADAIIAMREDAQAVYDTAARDGLTRHGQIYRASAYLRSCLPVEMRLGRPEMLAGRQIDGLNDQSSGFTMPALSSSHIWSAPGPPKSSRSRPTA